MDIGSIFPLYDSDFIEKKGSKLIKDLNNKIFYSLCREAFYDLASKYACTNKIVLIPAYTCDTVYNPFLKLGWQCKFYSVTADLKIDCESLILNFEKYRPAMLIVHPYYGMGLTDYEKNVLKKLKNKGLVLIIDNTQCIFSEERLEYVDYYVGSYRKWFPIPDGAFLENNSSLLKLSSPSIENDIFVDLQKTAMYLRGLYFKTGDLFLKDMSRKLNGWANLYAEDYNKSHIISQFSYRLLHSQETKANISKRFANYSYLLRNMKSNNVDIVCRDISRLSSAPLYFAIYTSDRERLQKRLAEDQVYAPILWPITNSEVLINTTIKKIYERILAIPIDQRYGEEDMKKVISIINQY